tara:strand:- start:753 stop:2645 length:1893 start_codon:yes stop_codon:yes gene_type:complete
MLQDEYTLLQQIDFPKDLRKLKQNELPKLADELRNYIIDVVAEHGGHLGASLGVVEITVALHYVFNTPNDLLLWDVGHQAYGHKILTGRREQFPSNRKKGGLSGFPNRSESEYDTFGVGHSSTAISAGLGMAMANKLKGKKQKVIAVVGDAALSAGLSFEGLNHAGVTGADMLIVINDNSMSIDPSVGALNEYLLRTSKHYKSLKDQIWKQLKKQSLEGSVSEATLKVLERDETNLFEALNFKYFGPVDGHDLNELVEVCERLKTIPGPKILHAITKKGKGYEPAEKGNATKWHAPGLFDKATGKILVKEEKGAKPPKFQDVFGHTLVELAEQNDKIVGITPAMPSGSSMNLMMDAFPKRAFDVGIAEQHAVTFSAGLATQGLLPFCNIYSTFMQRAYDQVIHDVAIQNLKVIFCLDRAGLVGADGATHQGVYDLAYMRCVPNITIAAPLDETDLRNVMYTAQLDKTEQSMVIRYPRGRGSMLAWQTPLEEVEIGAVRTLNEGCQPVCLLSTGTAGIAAQKAVLQLKEQGIDVAHFHFLFVKPLNEKKLEELAQQYQAMITVEDGTRIGGFGSAVAEWISQHAPNRALKIAGIPDEVIDHASPEEQASNAGIDAATIAAVALQLLSKSDQ